MSVRLALVGACLLALGCAAQPAEVAEAPVVGGEDDTGPERFPGVVYLLSFAGTACTGVIVEHDAARRTAIVATAGHCLFDDARRLATSIDRVRVGPQPTMPVLESVTLAITEHLHPAADVVYVTDGLDDFGAPYDVAVLEVTDVDASYAERVIPLATDVSDLAVGDAVEFAGFGAIDDDATMLATTRQRGAGTIAAIHPGDDGEPITIDVVRAAGGALGCPGDSGGPLLRRRADDTYEVIGVASLNDDAGGSLCGVGSLARYAAIDDRMRSFVDDVRRGADPAPETCRACAWANSFGGLDGCRDEAREMNASSSSVDRFLGCLADGTWSACAETAAAGAMIVDTYWRCLDTACDAACSPGYFLPERCNTSPTRVEPQSACGDCLATSCCEASAACTLDDACDACRWPSVPDDGSCETNEAFVNWSACAAACEIACAGVADFGDVVPVDAAAPADAATTSTSDAGSAADVGPAAGASGCACRAAQSERGPPITAWIGLVLAVFAGLARGRGLDRARNSAN